MLPFIAAGLSLSNRHTAETSLQTELLAPTPTFSWSCKSHDEGRTGYTSEHTGPSDFTDGPAWRHSLISETMAIAAYASPVIDHENNIYAFGTMGPITKWAPNGTVLWTNEKLYPTYGAIAPVLHKRKDGKMSLVGARSSGGAIFAVDIATGKLLYQSDFATSGKDSSAWMLSAADGIAVVPSSSTGGPLDTFNGVDLETGKFLWNYTWTYDKGGYNIMVAIKVNKAGVSTALVQDPGGGVHAMNLHTGKLLWKNTEMWTKVPSFTTAGCLITGETVVCGSNQPPPQPVIGSHPAQMKTVDELTTWRAYWKIGGVVHAHSLVDGKTLWVRKTRLPVNAGGAAANGIFYYGAGPNAPGSGPPEGDRMPWHGAMEAIDIATGKVLWSTPTHTLVGYISPRANGATPSNIECEPDAFPNPSVGADGTVYHGWHAGLVYALNGTTGAIKSIYPIGNGMQGNPAIGDGLVAFLTCNELVVFRS
ncbi:hypothetical protein AB1Y20_017575 [Prymnesium parvum]|uniref:Pyrrolo-quinoline quinone repeat domain-containing protein n=1 Tax=Prymnesium parvum TaxID=97485 RepID=A0AB34JKX9_PRYPA